MKSSRNQHDDKKKKRKALRPKGVKTHTHIHSNFCTNYDMKQGCTGQWTETKRQREGGRGEEEEAYRIYIPVFLLTPPPICFKCCVSFGLTLLAFFDLMAL